MKSSGLSHIHLVVRDLDRSVRFYRQVFGLEERFRVGKHMVFLGSPGQNDIITLNQNEREAGKAGDSGGVSHFGFSIAGEVPQDEIIRTVEAAGGRLVEKGEHAPGVPFVYVADPDGYVIEV